MTLDRIINFAGLELSVEYDYDPEIPGSCFEEPRPAELEIRTVKIVSEKEPTDITDLLCQLDAWGPIEREIKALHDERARVSTIWRR